MKEPRLTLLDDEISSTSVSSARLLLSGDEAESQNYGNVLPFAKEKSGLIIPRISEGLSRTDLYLCRLQGYRDILATNAATALSRQPSI